MPQADALFDLAEAMVEEIEPYLLSRDLHWPLQLRRPAPGKPTRLSLGALQLTLDELESLRTGFTQAQQARLAELHTRLGRLREKHASALQRKAQAEQQSRLRLWQAYLTDLAEGTASGQDFRREVCYRLMAARLAAWAPSGSAASAMVEASAAQDRRLQALFRPGPFVLEEHLQGVYPGPEYWYLYGEIRSNP